MTIRHVPVLISFLVLVSGCQVREAFFGVSEPTVQGTASPAFVPEDYPKLAVLVLPVTPVHQPRDGAAERAIADDTEQVLLGKGYALVARTDLGSVVAELALQNRPLSEADVARIGKRLGVTAVFVVAVTDDQVVRQDNGLHDYRLGMSAKLVGTGQGDVLWVAKTDGTHHVDSPQQRQDVIGPITRGLVKAFPIRPATIPAP